MKEHFCPAEQSTITYQGKCNWCGESEGSMTQEALKLALEALVSCKLSNYGRDWVWPVTAHEQAMKDVIEAITAIEEALAQTQQPVSDDIASILACRNMLDAQPVSESDRVMWPEHTEQEPVGQLLEEAYGRGQVMWFNKPKDQSMLYTTPPQRTWVGLTDEDKKQMAKEANYHWEMTAGEYAELIGHLTEAKLKEKNT